MFATVQFPVRADVRMERGNRTSHPIAIPETAIVTDGDTSYVFVEVGTRTYERRAVELVAPAAIGAMAAPPGRVLVASGLAAGDHVVVRGSFTLKAELGKAGFADDDDEGGKKEARSNQQGPKP
jgi:hypothetical protein